MMYRITLDPESPPVLGTKIPLRFYTYGMQHPVAQFETTCLASCLARHCYGCNGQVQYVPRSWLQTYFYNSPPGN